ncbi:hypothetical protein [Sporomusa malonica]|uniref:hypothetical protein n=1 Tax=Sporomusa malonica TaxID=112901 RepID=UPI0015946F12|nr:hypothetical protein [Sporomusa malonica]
MAKAEADVALIQEKVILSIRTKKARLSAFLYLKAGCRGDVSQACNYAAGTAFEANTDEASIDEASKVSTRGGSLLAG